MNAPPEINYPANCGSAEMVIRSLLDLPDNASVRQRALEWLAARDAEGAAWREWIRNYTGGAK